MSFAKRMLIQFARVISLGAILYSSEMVTYGQSDDSMNVSSAAGVFVLGGIHQAHEEAKFYTYDRMGQVYRHLKPDVLTVECLQEYIEDRSFRGMPFDFKRVMLPFAIEDDIPVYGIDWWNETRGAEWQALQMEVYGDSTMQCEYELLGGMFQLLNSYFCEKDFRDINADEITAIWSAMNELKYTILRRSPGYLEIVNYEEERNDHIVDNIMNVLALHPGKRVLVAVGIDHKYYIERMLRERGVHVLSVEEVLRSWWI